MGAIRGSSPAASRGGRGPSGSPATWSRSPGAAGCPSSSGTIRASCASRTRRARWTTPRNWPGSRRPAPSSTRRCPSGNRTRRCLRDSTPSWGRSASGWPTIYVRLELGLLQELGFGLDLAKCAATGSTDDLAYVSPRTGRAVSRAAAGPYKEKLLPLPGFLSTAAFRRTGGTAPGPRSDGILPRAARFLAAQQALASRPVEIYGIAPTLE